MCHSVFNGMVCSSGDTVALTERKCRMHVAASKLYQNKLVILSGVELVFMSPCLKDYHHGILNKLTLSR